jgi:hypothetical protein
MIRFGLEPKAHLAIRVLPFLINTLSNILFYQSIKVLRSIIL